MARGRTVIALVGLVASLAAIGVPQASAVILPAVTIDGPNEDIGGVGGVAMAEDGSGGVVYLKRTEGVMHVFVSRYVAGHWLAPIRVDTGEQFAASWPRIGASSGGELVVTWATPFATENGHPVDEMLGATLGPGAAGFGPAIVIDANIEAGTGTNPDLAMSTTGQADLVYRVVESEAGKATTIPLLRPGDVVESVRVAHYDGARWSLLGRINRDPGVSMRPPTQANAPQIAIGATGNAIVVWQEPEINGVARIWARRLFGSSIDYVLPVSATSIAGAPLRPTRTRRASRSRSSAKPRSPTARRRRPARRFLGRGSSSTPCRTANPPMARIPGRERRRTRLCPVAPELRSDRRASTSTNSANCVSCTTRTAPRESSRATTSGWCGRSRWDRPSRAPNPFSPA